MPIATLADMTWEEVDTLDRRRTVAILPVGAIEAHGPHLPLGTDGIIAEAMAHAGAARLHARGYHVLILPRIDYTPASFAAAFPGTISLPGEIFTQQIVSLVRALARQGIETTVIANSHFDPENLSALRHAVKTIFTDSAARLVFPDLTRKPWALRLTDEFKSGACHAGQYEGSIVLAAKPEAVRASIQSELPDNPRSLTRAMREGHTTFEAAGGPRAYFGFPSMASEEEGHDTIATLGEIIEEATLEALNGAGADTRDEPASENEERDA